MHMGTTPSDRGQFASMSTDTEKNLDLEAWYSQEVPCEASKRRTQCPEGDSGAKWRITLIKCGHYSLFCTHHTSELLRYMSKPGLLYCDDCDKNYLADREHLKVGRL